MTLPPGLDTLTEADIEAMIFKAEDYERLFDRVPLRVKKTGRSRSWAKVRAYRQRRRRGECVLRIVVPECAIAEFLTAAGRLTEAEALDRRRVEQAAAEVLVELAARWRASR
jgi:hypothetical protein